MNIIKGITYNIKGMRIGLTTPRLRFLGLVRFGAVVLITIATASVILYYHGDLMNLIWKKPSSLWVIWIWYLASWLTAFVLMGISAMISYLAAQILFAVFIMDMMSRITEATFLGEPPKSSDDPFLKTLLFLIKQEIPRALLPIFVVLVLTLLAWLTPLGPAVTILTSLTTGMFLAWDNTDLAPARKLVPFKERLRFFIGSLPFHLGFGLLFLIPVFNVFSLSFAPIGATLYSLEKQSGSPRGKIN